MKETRLPITPSTVEILGHRYAGTNLIWAGLRLHEATLREGSIWGQDDHHLAVPWCHVDEAPGSDCDATYRVRPRDPAWRFVRATNGAWILQKDPQG